jgi:hypothetical protein
MPKPIALKLLLELTGQDFGDDAGKWREWLQNNKLVSKTAKIPNELPSGFSRIDQYEDEALIETELKRELKPGHPLFNLPVAAVARRNDQDDILLVLLDGSGRIAVVHLTWMGEKEKPPWPSTVIFDSTSAWLRSLSAEYPKKDANHDP